MKAKLRVSVLSAFLLVCGISAFAQDLNVNGNVQDITWLNDLTIHVHTDGTGGYNGTDRINYGKEELPGDVNRVKAYTFTPDSISYPTNYSNIRITFYRFFKLPGTSDQTYRVQVDTWINMMESMEQYCDWFGCLNPDYSVWAEVTMPEGSFGKIMDLTMSSGRVVGGNGMGFWHPGNSGSVLLPGGGIWLVSGTLFAESRIGRMVWNPLASGYSKTDLFTNYCIEWDYQGRCVKHEEGGIYFRVSARLAGLP